MAERLLAAREAAERLRLSLDTLYGWRGRPWRRPEGFPEGFIVGNRLRYREADIDAYICAQAEASKT
jgi:predicted DNA-binding transcriptional regulator AlpA